MNNQTGNQSDTQAETKSPDDRKITDLLRVLEISRRLALSTDLQSLLSRIEGAALEVLDCERATVFVHDGRSDELFSCVDSRTENIHLPADQGIAGACFQNETLLNIPDAYQDPRFNPRIDQETGFRTQNLLACPLSVSEQHTLGVLEVLNKSAGVFNEYDETLLETFAAQCAIALHRQFLMNEYGERKRIQGELAIARQIQQRLLPKESPVVEGFDIAGWSQPAEETGGDFFDFQVLENGDLLLVIADVTGHGIGPALLAAQCSALQQAVFSLEPNVPIGLSHINRLLCEDIPEDRFVTAFVGALTASQNELGFISAGHGPVVLLRQASQTIEELPIHSLPLGVLSNLDYGKWERIHFKPGDMLIALTDGFVEWENDAGTCFGRERLDRVILHCANLSASDFIARLYDSLLSFVKGSRQNDDLTAIVLKKL